MCVREKNKALVYSTSGLWWRSWWCGVNSSVWWWLGVLCVLIDACVEVWQFCASGLSIWFYEWWTHTSVTLLLFHKHKHINTFSHIITTWYVFLHRKVFLHIIKDTKNKTCHPASVLSIYLVYCGSPYWQIHNFGSWKLQTIQDPISVWWTAFRIWPRKEVY